MVNIKDLSKEEIIRKYYGLKANTIKLNNNYKKLKLDFSFVKRRLQHLISGDRSGFVFKPKIEKLVKNMIGSTNLSKIENHKFGIKKEEE